MPRRRPLPAEDALARAVLDRTLGLRRGESVTIETWSHSLPWARSFVVEARRRGAVPTLVVEDETAFFRSLSLLGHAEWSIPSGGTSTREDALVYFPGPEAFPRLLGLPPPDLDAFVDRHDGARSSLGRRPPSRTVRLGIGDVTATAAVRYGVDPVAWQNELLKASLVDPRRLERTGRRFARRVSHARRLRIRHPNGTDLTAELSHRAPTVDSGRPPRGARAASARVPSGILLLPIRRGSAEGTWETNRPSYDRFAVPPAAVGGRFEFRRGRLTGFEFERGGAPFANAYARAGRGRERPVALTIGLNPAISRAPESAELGLGTVGVLLGDFAHRGAGGRSEFSFLAVLAGADVDVDDRPWILRGIPLRRSPGPPGGRRSPRR
jgi:hypothetical protein